jgi:ubiquinone/menaquinone biosynthesis C-methylase UbiE
MYSDMKNEVIEANKEFYDKYATEYDNFQWYFKNGYEQRMWWKEIEFICKSSKRPLKVLDIGCGTGNLTLKFLNFGCYVTAMDISQNILDVLKSKIPPEYKDRVKLVHVELDQFVKDNTETFDVVAECSVLHHLPDYYTYLEKVSPLVKEGGYIYITREPVHKSELAIPSKISQRTHDIINISQDYSIKLFSWLKLFHKTKAPDHSLAAYHYTKDGISTKAIVGNHNNLCLVFNRKYNRRRMTFYSYLDNVILGKYRVDKFQYSWFSMLLRKPNSALYNCTKIIEHIVNEFFDIVTSEGNKVDERFIKNK